MRSQVSGVKQLKSGEFKALLITSDGDIYSGPKRLTKYAALRDIAFANKITGKSKTYVVR
jgi:hypothetical protein